MFLPISPRPPSGHEHAVAFEQRADDIHLRFVELDVRQPWAPD
jgi:hypothetical protein